MRSIRIVPSTPSTIVEELTIASKVEFNRALNCDCDDEDTTVGSTSENSGSLADAEVMEGSMARCCDLEETSESLSKLRVSFGTLEIHEHAMELGGSGIPRLGGAPVTMSWERQSYFAVNVEEYDDLKGPSRTGEQLFLNPKHRMAL